MMGNLSKEKTNWLLWLPLSVLVGAFALQYYTVFGNLLKRWGAKDFGYCYLVPFIFVYMAYSRKQSLKALTKESSATGFAVLLLSGFLYLAGLLGSTETLTYMSLWLSIIGLCLLLLGNKVAKQLAFAFLVLAFIVPLPPFLNRLFTFRLKLISSTLSVKMMQVFGLSAHREGNIIDLGLTQLQVVDACSGLRYVYPLLLMGLLFGYFFHKKWWERLVIILAVIPISVLSNALRIAITGYLSKEASPQIADTFFHGFSGWLIFMLSFAFLLFLSWIMRIGKRRKSEKTPPAGRAEKERPARPLGLKLSYLWIASAMFVAFWGLNTWLFAAQKSPHRKTFEAFPTRIGDWVGEKTHLRQEILNVLWADDYVQITFTHSQTRDVLLLFVSYYEYQGTRHTAHSPVACLVSGGFAPTRRTIIENEWPAPYGPVKIRQMVFEKNRQLLLSNYWFQQRGRIVLSEYLNKWYLFWDSLTKRRTDGALVRIEMPLNDDQRTEEAQDVLNSFIHDLVQILPQYVPS